MISVQFLVARVKLEANPKAKMEERTENRPNALTL